MWEETDVIYILLYEFSHLTQICPVNFITKIKKRRGFMSLYYLTLWLRLSGESYFTFHWKDMTNCNLVNQRANYTAAALYF